MAPFLYRGRLRKDRRTKILVQRLRPGEIALVAHADMDCLAAEALIRCGTRVVLNTEPFSRGIFPPFPVELLLKEGVYLLERVTPALFDQVAEGEILTLRGEAIYWQGREMGRGERVNNERFQEQCRQSSRLRSRVVDRFIVNTLSYAYRERQLITGELALPVLDTRLEGRQAVVVVRGKGYREDLQAIRSYLREETPVLIGVDGGADALLEFGFIPDILIGDMDSVSDRALRCSRERVVHAYPNGRGAPGKRRLEEQGLDYHILTAPGTSEDIALLLAYERKSVLIVAIGTHFSVMEFLEKGRLGMASTFLTRLKVGDRLIDAKGVSRLYTGPRAARLLPVVVLAGLVPLLVLAVCSPLIKHFLYLLVFKIRCGL